MDDEIFTVERVEKAFERLRDAMVADKTPSVESVAFVDQCLLVAARYIEKVSDNGAGIRIADNVLITMSIVGGVPAENRIRAAIFQINGSGLLESLTTQQVVERYGANNFARLVCNKLDELSEWYEDKTKKDAEVDTYMKARLAKHA